MFRASVSSTFVAPQTSSAYVTNERRLLRAIQSAQKKYSDLENIADDLRRSVHGLSGPNGPSGSVLSDMTKGTFVAYQILEYAAQKKCNELMAVELIDIDAVHYGLVTQQIWTLLNGIKHVELMPYSVPKEHECIQALRSQQPLGIKKCRAILADFYHNYFVYREVFV